MAENNLFAECIVSIIPSKEFSQQYIDEVLHLAELTSAEPTLIIHLQLKKTLADNGAGVLELSTDGKVRLEGVTHIISTTSDFPQYRAACEQMIPVIVPEWIKSSLLKNRQAQLRPFTPDPKLFFSGVIVCCADLPDNDKDAIVGGVLAMGGQESSNLTKLVTHIVALTVDNAKIQQALEKKLKCKFVLPHWLDHVDAKNNILLLIRDRFDDCLKLGRRIDEGPYLLPDPEILRKSAIDPVQYPSSASVQGAMSSRPEDLPQPPDVVDGSRHRLSVFKKKKVMLSADLGLSGRLRKIIEDLLEGGGGTITTTIFNADIYVCHYREGKDYIIASQTGKDVGNLSWLYYLIIHNEWTSPFRRLLHYPIPRQGIPGFKDFRISLSNYWGDARLYLENLVIAAGAEYTKNMKVDNTHLITARKSSEKCEAAVEWNINMVNHLWIEESYAKCEMQSLSNPRYTHFPPRTNLGEVIGQTQFDPTILEKLYFPEDSEDPEDPEDSSQARVAMQVKDQNAPVARKLESDPVALSNTPTAKKRGRKAQSRVISHTVTPSNNRLIGHGKENETPSSTSSRGAKDRALSKLHDLAPDVALYEKEKKRGGGVWGGKRAADRIERESSRKRFSSPTGDENNSSDEGSPEVKRPRTGLPPIRMRLLITGYKRWLGSVDVERAEKVSIWYSWHWERG